MSDSASNTRPGARASQPDPQVLLAWMVARGPGDIPARAISDAGPRPFRRRTDADVAIAALTEAGVIMETCSKPRAFRVVATRPAGTATLGLNGETSSLWPIPLDEVRQRFDEGLARHADQGLTGAALHYIAGRSVHNDLRKDPRLIPAPRSPDTCAYCGAPNDETFKIRLRLTQPATFRRNGGNSRPIDLEWLMIPRRALYNRVYHRHRGYLKD